jgi:hypothetical protein
MTRWRLTLAGAAVASVAAAMPAVGAASPVDHGQPSVFWSGSPHEGVSSLNSFAFSVAAAGPDNVWAVGTDIGGRYEHALIEHWAGAGWSRVPTPRVVGARNSFLSGVDAIGPNNVWAVGSFEPWSGGSRTLIEHWNGTSWSRVPSPNPGTDSNGTLLTGVTAVSADEIWAVGYADPPGSDSAHPVTIRWDGDRWTVVNSPSPRGVDRGFFGVSASAATNGWAVGLTVPGHAQGKAFASHWNGHAWHQAAVPQPGAARNELASVSIVAPGDVWAVGEFANGFRAWFPLVVHRVEGHWTRVRIPGLGVGTRLWSVSGDGPDDVWAVGTSGGPASRSLLVHWDGQAWSTFAGPDADDVGLYGVTTHGTTATWAVGFRSYQGHLRPFEERWNGHVWTR